MKKNIWGSTGHNGEVQGTVRKYRAPCRSTGHGESARATVGNRTPG